MTMPRPSMLGTAARALPPFCLRATSRMRFASRPSSLRPPLLIADAMLASPRTCDTIVANRSGWTRTNWIELKLDLDWIALTCLGDASPEIAIVETVRSGRVQAQASLTTSKWACWLAGYHFFGGWMVTHLGHLRRHHIVQLDGLRDGGVPPVARLPIPKVR
jgi:hypothetical protein